MATGSEGSVPALIFIERVGDLSLRFEMTDIGGGYRAVLHALPSPTTRKAVENPAPIAPIVLSAQMHRFITRTEL